jgi:hypothetical protein
MRNFRNARLDNLSTPAQRITPTYGGQAC